MAEDRVKQQILEQSDIGEVAGQYVRLQNRGGRLLGLCPFHKEKTPSFSVNPDRGFFHCFGCGKGGNVIDFVMGVENLTYSEARRHLASKLGIKIDTPSGTKREHDEIDRYQVMDQAAQFYVKCLQNNQAALKYLQSRELKPEHIKQYGLGFASDEWDSLLTAFRQRKIPEKVLAELGLIIPRKDSSGFYDRFRNRIMFPIKNTLGRVIAFGGRSMDPADRAKYLNSNDTPLFNKSKVLYLLDKAKDVLKDRGAVLVEGYMDAISMHARGFQQAVASLGTALTNDHIHILRRYTKDFTLLYDGDTAGIRAAMRGVELFFESGHTVRVALLPESMDPDDYIKKHGADAMQGFLNQANDGFDFYVQQASQNHDAKTTQGKVEIVEATLPLFAKIGDPLIQKDCMALLARHLGNQEISVIESTILKKLKSGKYKTYSPAQENQQPAPVQHKKDSYAIIKEPLIRLLAFSRGLMLPEGFTPKKAATFFLPEKIEEISELLTYVNEQSPLDELIVRLLHYKTKDKKANQAARMAAVFPENNVLTSFLRVTEAEPLPKGDNELQRMLDDILEDLKEIKIKQERQDLFKQAESDPKKALQAFNRMILAERESPKE